LLKERERLVPFMIGGKRHRCAVGLNDFKLVFRIGRGTFTFHRLPLARAAEVAERLHSIAIPGRDWSRRLDLRTWRASEEPVERDPKRLPRLCLSVGVKRGAMECRGVECVGVQRADIKQVYALVRIAPKIVELFARGPDVTIAGIGDRDQLAQ